MSTAEQRGRKQIEEMVRAWTSKYLFHVTLSQKQGSDYTFMVEFSLPTNEKPIPISTVQVYFYLKDLGKSFDIKFRFEKDSLVHTPDKSIRNSQMEQWIESFLVKKLLTRENVFYLGTEYELTRVKDARQDAILYKKPPVVIVEEVSIAPQLLADQRRHIEIMESNHLKQDHKKIMEQAFKSVDTSGMGVVTIAEFKTILVDKMKLKLTTAQIEEIISKADGNKTGMVEYSEYVKVVEEIAKGLLAKEESIKQLEQREEEYQLESILMMINEETHNVSQVIFDKFHKLDEDEVGYLKLPDIKKVLEETSQASQPPLLTLVQLSEFTKLLSTKYTFNEVPYKHIHKDLMDFKVANLKKGLIESNLNNLEVYLREIFDPFDKDKFGKIQIDDMLKAFDLSDKIKLTKGQKYVLRSVVDKDDKDMVNYINSSKEIAELIKKFYLISKK